MLQIFSLPGENRTSSNVSKSSPLTDLVLRYFILKPRLMVQGHMKSRFVQLILKLSEDSTEYCNLISKCNKFGCVYDLSNSLMFNLNYSCRNIHDDVDVRFKTITLNYVSVAECGYVSLFHVFCCVLFLFLNGSNKRDK